MKFIFKSYNFNRDYLRATFNYEFEGGQEFSETIDFRGSIDFDENTLERALFLAFILIGTSYYKAFPTKKVEINGLIDEWQANFFNKVFQNGLGQFAFENNLKITDLAEFISSTVQIPTPTKYSGDGILTLQSGGKDSLLTASLLGKASRDFESLYVSSGENYPEFLSSIGSKLHVISRNIDRRALNLAKEKGGLNGHVPVTYIIQSIALIQAILLNKSVILTSIAHEGEEPHTYIDETPITHQWSKTFAAETAFSEYVFKYVSHDIMIGSPLRSLSELRVAELFVENVWRDYGYKFSSCNVANYKQGSDNTDLKWCGDCPKCANSYLLFAPFLSKEALTLIFNGQDLFEKPSLINDFKGLLGIDGAVKPFECVGEIDELRLAYKMAQQKGEYAKLPFDVPDSSFDYKQLYPAQDIFKKLVNL